MSTVTVACTLPMGAILTVNGVSVEVGTVTPGVDAGFWAAWLAQNQNSPMVQNGVIYATPDGD